MFFMVWLFCRQLLHAALLACQVALGVNLLRLDVASARHCFSSRATELLFGGGRAVFLCWVAALPVKVEEERRADSWERCGRLLTSDPEFVW